MLFAGIRRLSWLAPAIAATLVLTALPVLSAPAGDPVLSGIVLSAHQRAPVSGARVHLRDPETGNVITSEPTGPGGEFRFPDVVRGTYNVAVEYQGGLYPMDAPLRIQSLPKTVEFTIRPEMSPARTAKKSRVGARPGMWDNPVTATLMIVGSVAGAGLLVGGGDDDDDEDTASPSN